MDVAVGKTTKYWHCVEAKVGDSLKSGLACDIIMIMFTRYGGVS